MKHAFLIFLLCLAPFILLADFQRDVPLERTQPDGTKITLYGTGDEYYGVLRDANKYTALLDPASGYYCYSVKEGREIKPSPYKVGLDDPAAVGLEPNMTDDVEAARDKAAARKAVTYAAPPGPNSRTAWNNLVFFISLFGTGTYDFTYPFDTYASKFNNNTNSVRAFFAEESGGQEIINSYFAPTPQPYDDIHCNYVFDNGENYYIYLPHSATNPVGYTSFSQGMDRLRNTIRSKINYISSTNNYPTADYDMDNDGVVDNITIVLMGNPGDPGDVLYPRTDDLGPGASLGSLLARQFNLVFEYGSTATTCHELSHSIGFPNLYRSNSYVSDYHPVSTWDIMDEHGDLPTHSLVYMKRRYGGWCSTIPQLTLGESQSLDAVFISPFAGGRITSVDTNEYYYMEYRRQLGYFEAGLPGSGLIIYRVNTSEDGEGNYNGPPDEVYVYRPNGTLDVNGNPEAAFFSLQSGRTFIFETTNPPPFLSNGDYGGLSVSSIGNAGTSISFVPNMSYYAVWSGIMDTSWGNLLNWRYGYPAEDVDARIPGGLNNYPLISATADCNNLTIYSGAYITINSTLIVHGSLNSNGAVSIINTNSLEIYGSANWKSGSTVVMGNDNCFVQTRGGMTFAVGNNVHATAGRWLFSDSAGSPNSNLYVEGNAEINILECYKTSPNYLNLICSSGKTLTVNNGVYVYSGKLMTSSGPGILDTKGNLTIQSGGYFHPEEGIVRFSSAANRSVTMSNSAGNYFYNLEIAMQNNATLTINTATKVKHNLTISSGIFNQNNLTLYVEGDWTNMAGETHYNQGTGQVIFSGQSPSSINNEHFNTFINQKYETEQIIIPTGSTVRIASYDWADQSGTLRVNGGYLMIDDLADTNIAGLWQVDSGEAEVHQDAANTVNLGGSITMNGGLLRIVYDGAANTSTWTVGSLTMSGGVIDFPNSGISIPSGTTGFSCTGGTVKTQYNLSLTRSNVNLQNSTFEMYGSTDALITHGTASNSHFGNIIIDKASRNSEANQLSEKRNELFEESGVQTLRTNTVTAGSGLQLYGLLNVVSGSLNINGYYITAYGGIDVSGHIQMASGLFSSYTSYMRWNNGSTTNITGGTIECEGNWEFNEGSHAHLDALSILLQTDDDNRYIKSCSSDSWFGNLTISMYTDYEIIYALSTSSTVPLKVHGNLAVNEMTVLDLGTKSLTVNGDVTLSNQAKLKLGKGAVFSMASAKTLNVNTGCTLEMIGVQDTLATLTHQTGYYNVNLLSGSTIKAQYALFEYVGTNGVNIQSGATVDNTYSLNFCTFRNGVAPGTLLTINNNQVINAYKANFPTWAGTGSYNAKKSVNEGTVTFNNATGTYAGGSYESDPNGRIFWTTTNCELSILSYSGTPNPLHITSPITLSATIRNNSINPVLVPIRVDVYFNRPSLPAAMEAGDLFGYLDPIGANASATYTFPETSSGTAGTWQTWFRVDRLNEIAETNETNNGNGPLTVTWTPLPPVEMETIYYDPFTQMIILTWTYSLAADSYNVYRSVDAYGPFSELAGNTTDLFYSEFESGPRYFYQVRAVRNWP